jgi:hypothetical protein
MEEKDTAPSLRELAKLSVAERNQILAAYVPMMAEDFANMPELTEFSVLTILRTIHEHSSLWHGLKPHPGPLLRKEREVC